MKSHTYLHIRGTLIDNMIYRPRPGYESTRPGRHEEGDPSFQLLLLSRENRSLASAAPQVSHREHFVGEPLRCTVRGVLPLHPEGAAYELRRGDVCLHRRDIPAAPPRFAEAPRSRKCGRETIVEWQPAEPATVSYSIVAAMESERRITLARQFPEHTYTLDLDSIPASGKGTLYLVASDGVRSSEVEITPLDLPARPPSLHIISPSNEARLPFGQPVSAIGCCVEIGGRAGPTDQVVWSLNGKPFAHGSLVAAIEIAEPGRHLLTLACESEGGRAETRVSIEVEPPDASYQLWKELVALPSREVACADPFPSNNCMNQ